MIVEAWPRLNESQKALAEADLSFAVDWARRALGSYSKEEAEGAAHIGIVKAATSFRGDPIASSGAWKLWLKRCVLGEAQHIMRDYGRHYKLQEKLFGLSKSESALDQGIEAVDVRDEVAYLMKRISPRDRAALLRQYESNSSASEMSAAMGLSRRGARFACRSAMEFMWRDLNSRFLKERGKHERKKDGDRAAVPCP